MSDSNEGVVHTIPIPDAGEPGSYQMVNALLHVMHSVAQSLPFEFHPADLISAHLKAAFDLAVLNTTMTPREIHGHLTEGLNALLGDTEESKRRAN
jgi:hypothetical protein